MNLTKNLIGAGIFSLPTAMQKGSVLPGLATMLMACVVQGGTFVLIAFLCQRLGASSYRGVVSAAFGAEAGSAVDLCIMTNSFFACVAYNILVADFLQKSLEGLMGWTGVPRPLLIWLNTIFITLPLSHARNLSPLRYTSLLGLAIIAGVWMKVIGDCLGQFDTSRLHIRDNLFRLDHGLFLTLAICTGAFQAHYNAPKFFRELGFDLRLHKRMVLLSYSTAFLVYSLFALSGVGLFGPRLLGNVLKNYPAEGDVAVLLAWLGMAFAIVFTYPLVFTTGRDSFLGLCPPLQRAGKRRPLATHVAVTSLPVAIIATVACAVEDVSKITGLLGSTIGACLCWIFPAIIYLRVTRSPRAGGLKEASEPLLPGRLPPVEGHPALRACARCMIGVGFSSMAVGICRTLGLL